MEDKPVKVTSSKRVPYVIAFLFVWPLILILLSIGQVYNQIGQEVDTTVANQIIGTASIGVYIAIIVGPISWLVALYLLYKRYKQNKG